MIAMYGIDYTNAAGSRETLTVYAYGGAYGAGVSAYGSDPDVIGGDTRALAHADTFDLADMFAASIADIVAALVPGSTLHVRQGDDVPV